MNPLKNGLFKSQFLNEDEILSDVEIFPFFKSFFSLGDCFNKKNLTRTRLFNRNLAIFVWNLFVFASIHKSSCRCSGLHITVIKNFFS